MFKRNKAKQIGQEAEVAETERKAAEEAATIVDHTVPNAETAFIVVRDAINDYVMCICNISKQHKHDIGTCLDYLLDYIREHNEVDSIINSIDDNSLIQLSKTFERNGYTIDIDINKADK